jgi:di/tricarboxylate transporter
MDLLSTPLLPEDWRPWFTAAMLIVMVVAIASGQMAIDVVVVGVLAALIAVGVVEPGEAVRGFGNPALVTIAALYVVAAALQRTGAISMLSARLLGRPRSALAAQARLLPQVALFSAFANNTPIVATYIPMLTRLSRLRGIPVGLLMIPLSFAAILGGLCTLIGTSTMLVVQGMMIEADKTLGVELPSFEMLTVTPVGVPVALVGLAYLLLVGWRLLPRGGVDVTDPDQARHYMAALRVEAGSPVIGRTIEQAELRNLPGLFLSRIERDDRSLTAVDPETELREGDELVFVGVLESLKDLRQIRGLSPAAEGSGLAGSEARRDPHLRLVEAVVSPNSPLVGRTIRGAGIRTRYGAVVVAVQRLGTALPGKIGSMRLRPGDTLLLETGQRFLRRYQNSAEFTLVSEAADTAPIEHERAWLSLMIFGGFVVALLVGVHPMTASLVAAGAMLLTRCCRGAHARQAVDWSVIVIIGAAFGLGTAMETSGLARMLAEPIARAASALGPGAALALIYAITVVATTFVTNAAAAVLMFPIALEVALVGGYAVTPFAVCVAIAASAEFTTPIGYHTNLMVMTPGGYRFLDYVRVGAPLTLLAGVVAVLACLVAYPP